MYEHYKTCWKLHHFFIILSVNDSLIARSCYLSGYFETKSHNGDLVQLVMRHNDFCKEIDSYINGIKINVSENSDIAQISETCKRCPSFNREDVTIKDDFQIKRINISFYNRCNLKCVYCNLFNRNDNVNIEKALQELYGAKLINDETIFEFGSGEICIYEYRDELFDLLLAHDNFSIIATNATIYNEKLSKLINDGKAKLHVSLDCGTRETYKSVKGVDCFDKVIRNIRNYIADDIYGNIELKYIVLENINDNKNDIEKFLEFAVSLNMKKIFLSANIDLRSNHMSADMFSVYKYFIQAIKDRSMLPVVMSDYFNAQDAEELIKLCK